MNVRAIIAAALIALAGPAGAQGFAGLGTEVAGFAMPDPADVPAFPEDHGAHPDFRIEWWYLTANLTAADGRPMGIQWTLFRTALAPGEGEGWESPQLWMGHAALTSADRHDHAERIARGGTGQAGVTASPFAAWIDDWQMAGEDLSDLRLTARGDAFSYDLRLVAGGPIVLHGVDGYSVKSAAGQASHYYSQPFFTVTGTVTRDGVPVEVTGQAWLDREWSSQPLAPDQTGWDWFSLHLEGGEKVMGFVLRGARDYTSASWITPDGMLTAYPDGAFAAEVLDRARVAGRDMPTRWRVRLPDRGLDVTVTPLNPQSWMATSVPYWEGPVTVEGSHAGRGYLEMTGHD